jgi:hypothetical protein
MELDAKLCTIKKLASHFLNANRFRKAVKVALSEQMHRLGGRTESR